jgi:hypothetical protein
LDVAALITIRDVTRIRESFADPPKPWRERVIFQANPLAYLHRIDPTQRLMRSQAV